MSEIKLEQFSEIVKKAQTDKRTLLALKNVAVKCQDFELASHLRQVERELFPSKVELGKGITTASQRIIQQLNSITNEHSGFVKPKYSQTQCW